MASDTYVPAFAQIERELGTSSGSVQLTLSFYLLGLAVIDPLLFVCVATLGLVFPNATAAVMKPFPEKAGRASALLGMLQFGVGAAAATLVGLVHNGTALPMATLIALFSVAALLILRVCMRSSVPSLQA